MDLKRFEKRLAEYKVYDAWMYVTSLAETLSYLEISYNLIKKVYDHLKNELSQVSQKKLSEVGTYGKTTLTEQDFSDVKVNIGGYDLENAIFIRKTVAEFFHYARISVDVLIQIINAAILGDDAFKADDVNYPKVINAIKSKNLFPVLLQILDNNKNNNSYKYMSAFDNYMKHKKTILISIKNNIIFGENSEFKINEFYYHGEFFGKEDAIDKVSNIYTDITKMIENTLDEVYNQIPNCCNNSKRIQELHFMGQAKKNNTEDNDSYSIDYISFFIYVKNDLSELPSEIKVFPLIIKPNNEIYSFDFQFDKIFIAKEKKENEIPEILGCANIKNGIAADEFYRIFQVAPCSGIEYVEYLNTFKEKYSKISLNPYAMEGTMLFLND